MKKLKDSWCSPAIAESGQVVFGGAARNVRLKRGGGMDAIITKVQFAMIAQLGKPRTYR